MHFSHKKTEVLQHCLKEHKKRNKSNNFCVQLLKSYATTQYNESILYYLPVMQIMFSRIQAYYFDLRKTTFVIQDERLSSRKDFM